MAVGEFYRVIIEHRANGLGCIREHDFRQDGTIAAGAELPTLRDDMQAFIQGLNMAHLHTSSSYTGIQITQLERDPAPYLAATVSPAKTGTNVGESLTPGQCVLITWTAAFRDRQLVARSYLAGWVETYINAGAWATQVLDDAAAYGNALRARFNGVVGAGTSAFRLIAYSRARPARPVYSAKTGQLLRTVPARLRLAEPITGQVVHPLMHTRSKRDRHF